MQLVCFYLPNETNGFVSHPLYGFLPMGWHSSVFVSISYNISAKMTLNVTQKAGASLIFLLAQGLFFSRRLPMRRTEIN